ncbi:flagella basal body P-ring formation protein FlgA [Alienimonas sp. DA493]|uniref:flagella basal body P-ring formation protein FlgA n=1 Tax=Alienimonas sp. DA493 TaxID=3373605 RepID=UPI0037546EC5
MNRTTALAVACALVGAASSPAGVTVALKARAASADSVVRVGDVATVTADGPADAVAAARLRSVPLVPAPAKGRTATLSAAAVRDRARAGGFEVTMDGAKAVVLSAARTAVEEPADRRPASPGDRAYGEKFVTAAVSRALARAGAEGMRVEVALAPEAARTLARHRPDGCDLTGLAPTPGVAQTVTLRWLDRLENVVTVEAAVRLNPPRLVPVLTEPVPRGAPITADHIAWRPETAVDGSAAGSSVSSLMLAGGVRPAGPPPAADFAGRLPTGEAVRDLPAGAVVEADDLRQTPLVRANQTVRVESRVGGITVTRDLKATRNGLLGQTIPMADPDGPAYGDRTRIYARVVGNRRAVLVGEAAESPAYATTPGFAPTGGPR